MTAPHPLDRPVWHALTSRQSALAIGDARALRLAPDLGPFAAAADFSPESLTALTGLIPANGNIWLVEAEEIPPPPGVVVVHRAVCNQMLAPTIVPAERAFAILPLGEDDATEMLALATLTEPGPFLRHTHRLGGFIGVKKAGRLVAMGGERMRPDGFAEVSGICTHPEHRGRGYAAGLMRTVAERILARGEVPFLHVYASNTSAIALYQSLGFRFRRAVTATVFAHA